CGQNAAPGFRHGKRAHQHRRRLFRHPLTFAKSHGQRERKIMGITSQLLVRRYKSTEEANAKLSRLAQATSWRDDLLSRLAIARSLREPAAPPKVDAARKGKELRGETLFRYGHDTPQRSESQQRHEAQSRRDPAILPWFVALVTEHHGKSLQSDDEAFDLILAHWHRGLDLLIADLD